MALYKLLMIFAISISAVLSQQVEYAKPWEQGTNICAYITRKGIVDYKICTHCLPWIQPYGQKNIKFLYDCCPGFKRSARFGNKCVERERTWKLIPGLLRDHKLKQFADMIVDKKNGAGFQSIDNPKSPLVYTVIAPYKPGMLTNKLDIDFRSYNGQKNHPILFSVVSGRYYLNDFRNGMVLKTLFNDQELKITKYSNGIVCIECRVLVEPDHEAMNGVVHYFSGPLIPHNTKNLKRSSVMTLLNNNPDTKKFASSIPADIRKLLSATQQCNWYTVFAPNNAAWQRVLSEYGPEKARDIAKNHILRRGLYCSAAIISRISKLGPTFADQYLDADCLENGQRIIRSGCGRKSVVLKADMMACNGVVHLVDKPLVPMRAMSLKNALQSNCMKGYPMWLRYLRECDLYIRPNNKYAILIPTNAAFEWWKNYARFRKYYDRFQTDAAFRCRLIRFHIFKMSDERASSLRYLWLQQMGYRTNNRDRLWEVDYFMKMYYGSLLYFHYSPVVDFRSYRFEGGSIYFIDRVNMIPEQNIIDILPTRSDFSLTNKFTIAAKMDQNVFQKNRPRNLYLVVRNGGYTVDLQKQMGDKGFNVANFLLLHYVRLYLWGGDIGYFENGTRHYFMSGAGVELIFDREFNGTMYIGYKGLDRNRWAIVVEWNIFAIDGMIWVLDRPLPCTGKICKMKILEKEIWKVMSFACWESLKLNRKRKKTDKLKGYLDSVEGDKCFANYDVPKKESSEHGGR